MTSTLLIGTPCFGGQVSANYAQSVLNFQKACRGRGDAKFDSVVLWGDSLITRARQGIVTQFLGHPAATHLLFIDGDVGFWPDQIFRLLKFDVDVAAAAIARSRPSREAGLGTASEFSLDFDPEGPSPEVRDGFTRVRGAGTGLMLLKRSALQSMVEKYRDLRYRSDFPVDTKDPRYFSHALFNCMTEGKDGRFLSEDESFCRRWTALGGEIWVDTQGGLPGAGPPLLGGK